MSKKIKQIARLIGAAEIDYIRLVEVSARTRIRSPKDVGPVDLRGRSSARLKERQKDRTFFVSAVIEASVVSPEQPEEPVVSVKAEYELKYVLPKGFKVSSGDLKIFAEVNSIFNVWPYWREFIQSVVIRMNLPPLTLPLYRLADTVKAPAKEASKAKVG